MGLLFVILIIILAIIGVVAPAASSIMTALSIIMWILIVIEAVVAIYFVYGMIKSSYHPIIYSIFSSISSGVAIAFTASLFTVLSNKLEPDRLGDVIGFAFFIVPFAIPWLYGVCWLWSKSSLYMFDDDGCCWICFVGELLVSAPMILFAILG